MFVMQSKKLSDKLYDRMIAQDFAHNYFVTLTMYIIRLYISLYLYCKYIFESSIFLD